MVAHHLKTPIRTRFSAVVSFSGQSQDSDLISVLYLFFIKAEPIIISVPEADVIFVALYQ